MKFLILVISLVIAGSFANSDDTFNCYKCPHGVLPGQDCLNNATIFGEETTCKKKVWILPQFRNACETIIIDDRSASIHYNRRCAHNWEGEYGCFNKTIEIQGEGEFAGRYCYCNPDPTVDGELCNTDV